MSTLTPEDLLAHYDGARLWPADAVAADSVAAAYQSQWALRRCSSRNVSARVVSTRRR